MRESAVAHVAPRVLRGCGIRVARWHRLRPQGGLSGAGGRIRCRGPAAPFPLLFLPQRVLYWRARSGARSGVARKAFDDIDVGEQLKQLDEKISELRVKYELFFSGVERRPPLWLRSEVQRMVQDLRRVKVLSTQEKFRFNSLTSRLGVLSRYWDRIQGERDGSRFSRDLARARRGGMLPADGQPAKPAPEAPAQARATARADRTEQPAGLSAERLQSLHRTYVAAKKKCGESTAGITMEALARSVQTQIPKLRDTHGWQRVDFKVVIKGGRTVLKAVKGEDS